MNRSQGWEQVSSLIAPHQGKQIMRTSWENQKESNEIKIFVEGNTFNKANKMK